MASSTSIRNSFGSRGLLALLAGFLTLAASAPAAAAPCLDEAELLRVARVIGPDGRASYVRVVEAHEGVPTLVSPIADGATPLAEVFEQANRALPPGASTWRISEEERRTHICSPVPLRQHEIYAEERVVIGAGLNYAAHAEEAGGGDVFLFPKPSAPSAPYGIVAPPDGVVLLDYEVELAYVLLSDIDIAVPPSRESFVENVAFFVANDITDREAIIRNIRFVPPGIGFVEAKGQPNFLPAGPWMVRGRELIDALGRCGEPGLGIGLSVDEGNGFKARQNANTAAMIVKPHELIAKIADQIATQGLRTEMPYALADETRYFPLAIESTEDGRRVIPAGSVVVTGTPEGVAMQAPSTLPLALRGLLRLRSPLEQFRREQIERATSGEPTGYLAPGDRVRAWIDGLGAQQFDINPPGTPVQHDPCANGS